MAVDAATVVALYNMLMPEALVPYVLLGVTVRFAYDIYAVLMDALKRTISK